MKTLELMKKYKMTAVTLAVSGSIALGLIIDPQLALIGAEVFDMLAEIASGIAAAGAEAAAELPAE